MEDHYANKKYLKNRKTQYMLIPKETLLKF